MSNASIESLLRLFKAFHEQGPIERFMISKGCPPSEGWKLILPEFYREIHDITSEHVEYSLLLDEPLLVNSKIPCSYRSPVPWKNS